jgi:ribosomal protein S27AE
MGLMTSRRKCSKCGRLLDEPVVLCSEDCALKALRHTKKIAELKAMSKVNKDKCPMCRVKLSLAPEKKRLLVCGECGTVNL